MTAPASAYLGIREIHLRMLLLKLLQHLHLLLVVTARQSHLLLPLVVHHLLHHAPRLSVQIAELAVLRRNLRRVDLGRSRDDVRPPLHLVGLVEVDRQFLAVLGGFERPGGFIDDDVVRKGALKVSTVVSMLFPGTTYVNERLLAFDASLEAGLGDLHIKVFAFDVGRNRRGDIEIANSLGPFVREFALLFLLLLLCFCVKLLPLLRRGRCWSPVVGHVCVWPDVWKLEDLRGKDPPRGHDVACRHNA